jgi:hypothetical protein
VKSPRVAVKMTRVFEHRHERLSRLSSAMATTGNKGLLIILTRTFLC